MPLAEAQAFLEDKVRRAVRQSPAQMQWVRHCLTMFDNVEWCVICADMHAIRVQYCRTMTLNRSYTWWRAWNWRPSALRGWRLNGFSSQFQTAKETWSLAIPAAGTSCSLVLAILCWGRHTWSVALDRLDDTSSVRSLGFQWRMQGIYSGQMCAVRCRYRVVGHVSHVGHVGRVGPTKVRGFGSQITSQKDTTCSREVLIYLICANRINLDWITAIWLVSIHWSTHGTKKRPEE